MQATVPSQCGRLPSTTCAQPIKKRTPPTADDTTASECTLPLKVEGEPLHVLLHLLHVLLRLGTPIEDVAITVRTDHRLQQTALATLALCPKPIVLLFLLSEFLHPIHDDGC